MGALTRGVIVAEGLRLANESTGLSTRANYWLNAWLRNQYAATPWPFLIQTKKDLALGTGVTSLTVGSGSSGITEQVQRIFDPVFLYDTDHKQQGRARVKQRLQGAVSEDESVFNTTTKRGMPQEFKVRAPATPTYGQWVLFPNPVPEQDYLIKFDYIVLPANLTSDSDIPVYPSDETMIQAVAVGALHYDAESERYGQELGILKRMILDDRMAYAEVPGTNDKLELDQSVFR